MNPANQNDWPKETRKKYPIKVIQSTARAQVGDSPSESTRVPIHMYCTLFLQMNTLLASLLSVFVEILFCKSKGPGPLSLTTGLVARIWFFHCCNPTPTSGWEPKPGSKPLQPEAINSTQGQAPVLCQAEEGGDSNGKIRRV